MMSNAGSEEKTFNRVVCVPTETYFSGDNLPRQKIQGRLKINNSLFEFGMELCHSGWQSRTLDDQSAGFEKYIYCIFPGLGYSTRKKLYMHSNHNCQIQFVNVRSYGYNRLQVVFTLLKTIKCNSPFSSLECHPTVKFVVQFVPVVKGGFNVVQQFWRLCN